MEREIKKIVDRVLFEEINKAGLRIKNRIFENQEETCECGGMMYEGECMECGNMYEGNTQELGDNNEEEGFPEWEKLKKQMDDRNSYKDMGGANDDENNYRDLSTHNPYYGDDDEEEGFPEWEKLKKQMDNRGELKEDVCEECGDTYESELDERFKDNRKKIDKAEPYGKITPADFEALRSMKKEVEETLYELDLEEDDVEEGNAFSGALNLARKKGFKTFKVGNKTYPVDESFIFETDENYSKMSTNEIDELIKKIKKRNSEFKRLGKPIPDSSKEKLNQLYLTKKRKNKLDESRILFTETEVINLIENIVLEEKRKKTNNADNYLKSSLNQSKKQSEEYIDSVVQKMKGYLKNGSKGKYDMNPKGFPKGNGELETMSKMAYIPSKSVEEYVTNLTAAGLENIDYDEIHPDEDWVTDLMVGSSRTGNNPKWANSVETPTNKIRNKVRTDNYLSKIKKKAYNKAPQPIVKDKSGNDKGSGDFLSKLESVENRNIITDLEKMKNLITYGKKTQ